jgi:hypothetical protein
MSLKADRDLCCSTLRWVEREQLTSPLFGNYGNSREQLEQLAVSPWKSCSGAWEQAPGKTTFFPFWERESCSQAMEQLGSQNKALRLWINA